MLYICITDRYPCFRLSVCPYFRSSFHLPLSTPLLLPSFVHPLVYCFLGLLPSLFPSFRTRAPRNNKRPRPTAKAPADGDGDPSDEDDGEGPGDAGVDLIGKMLFTSSLLGTHDEGDRLVTEPGTHTDEDTGGGI